MQSIEILEKDLKTNDLQSIYFLYGEELFLIENLVKKIKNKFGEAVKGINFISIDDTNVQELISDIETPAFGYEKKLIIARNTNILKKEGKRKNTEIVKIREKLEEYIKENIDIIKESVVLVFIEEDVDTRFGLYKTFDKYGITCKVDFQKPIQLEKRIIAICNGYKVKIDNVTTKYFIETCGTNMQELINEIRKLIEYAGENGTIKKEDIDYSLHGCGSAFKDISNLIEYLVQFEERYKTDKNAKKIIELHKDFDNLKKDSECNRRIEEPEYYRIANEVYKYSDKILQKKFPKW